jgi:hypothetical protein
VVWISLSLIGLSVLMRFAGVAVFRVMCGTHWAVLFDPIPGVTHVSEPTRPLFPGLSPADFDDLIRKRRDVLRVLPPRIQSLAWWRLGLRNWSRAFFWIGVLAILDAVWL